MIQKIHPPRHTHRCQCGQPEQIADGEAETHGGWLVMPFDWEPQIVLESLAVREASGDMMFDIADDGALEFEKKIRRSEAKVHHIWGNETCGHQKLFSAYWAKEKASRNKVVVGNVAA